MRWERARAAPDGRVVCLEYSGTNAFGARRQAFAVRGPDGRINDAPEAWNAHCLGALPIVTSTARRLDGR